MFNDFGAKTVSAKVVSLKKSGGFAQISGHMGQMLRIIDITGKDRRWLDLVPNPSSKPEANAAA